MVQYAPSSLSGGGIQFPSSPSPLSGGVVQYPSSSLLPSPMFVRYQNISPAAGDAPAAAPPPSKESFAAGDGCDEKPTSAGPTPDTNLGTPFAPPPTSAASSLIIQQQEKHL